MVSQNAFIAELTMAAPLTQASQIGYELCELKDATTDSAQYSTTFKWITRSETVAQVSLKKNSD